MRIRVNSNPTLSAKSTNCMVEKNIDFSVNCAVFLLFCNNSVFACLGAVLPILDKFRDYFRDLFCEKLPEVINGLLVHLDFDVSHGVTIHKFHHVVCFPTATSHNVLVWNAGKDTLTKKQVRWMIDTINQE